MGLVTLTFDLETGMRVASEVRNVHSEFGHSRPLGSRVIRYERDGRTDGRTEKSKPYLPPFYGRWYNNGNFADTFYGVSIRPKYG